jgi:hypothetical protein
VRLVEGTDDLNTHADALCDLARAVVLAGPRGRWRAPLREALALYRRKGNLIGERHVVGVLASGRGPA